MKRRLGSDLGSEKSRVHIAQLQAGVRPRPRPNEKSGGELRQAFAPGVQASVERVDPGEATEADCADTDAADSCTRISPVA